MDNILRNSVSEEELVQNLELPFYENSRAQLYKGVKNCMIFGMSMNSAWQETRQQDILQVQREECAFSCTVEEKYFGM